MAQIHKFTEADRCKGIEAAKNAERVDPIEKARLHPTSIRKAVTAKCFDCVRAGWDSNPRRLVRECTITDCPLWPVRPWQRQQGREHQPSEGSMFSPARLRHERCQRLLPRELLAVLAGCSYDAIASYELGRRTPSSGTIARLAHALKVDVADLCDDVE